jgi:hypothetical protein
MSTPIYSMQVGGVTLNVVGVACRGVTQLQLYAAESAQRWELVGIYFTPDDATAALLDWHRYLTGGGTLAAWSKAHPDGVTPNGRTDLMSHLRDCTCHHDCDDCPLSGDWHVHPGEPCPVHPDVPVDN